MRDLTGVWAGDRSELLCTYLGKGGGHVTALLRRDTPMGCCSCASRNREGIRGPTGVDAVPCRSRREGSGGIRGDNVEQVVRRARAGPESQ